MKTLFRLVGLAVGLVVVVAGLAAAYLLFVFDPNDYRDQLANQVRQATGRALVIEGEIGLSVFPWLGVELERVSLGDAPGFGDQPFAEIARAQVRAELMPLLRREVAVDRIVANGLVLRLVRNEAGVGNWEDLGAREDASQQNRPDQASTTPAEVLGSVGAFSVGGIEVESAQVLWEDRQAGVQHTLSNLSVKTGEIRPGSRFPVALGLDFESSQPALTGRLDLTGQVAFQPAQAIVTVQDFTLRFAGRGDALPGGSLELNLGAGIALDVNAGTLDVSDVTLTTFGLEGQAQLRATGLQDTLAFSGELKLAEFNPRALLQRLGQPVGAVTDTAVLTRASLRSEIDGSLEMLALRNLEIQLDDSTVRGDVAIVDLSTQALRFDLALDRIDVDRYLPPNSAGNGSSPATTPGAGAATATVAATAGEPVGLRSLNLEGRIGIGQLIVSGLTASDIEINVKADDGLIRLAPLGANLYQGRYAGNVTLDARGAQMRLTLDETVSGVQIGPLLRDLTGEPERLTGQANLTAKLQAVGNDAATITRSLGGNATFGFADGALQGVNVAQFMREASARLRGQPVPEASGTNQTDFTELSGTVKFTDGVAQNDDLSMRSPLLRIAGQGTADLGTEQIDYRIQASLVGTLEGQGGTDLSNLRGVTVPVRVSGSFSQPRYALDVERLLSDNVRQQARDRIEQEIQERVPENLQENLRRGLRGLLR